MDFAFTTEEVAFRSELQSFLAEELPDWWRGMFVEDERAMPETRRICRKLAERGWLTMAWPPEFGGSGASVWMQTVVREEMWAHEEPRGPQYMNLNYIGPLIMRFGSPDQQQRFLPPMARGEVIWCQGFSEPDAGSDLASLATRAEDRGDHFVVNGRKLWTSYADAPADRCLLLVRTDPDASKHRGISVLLVDMTAAGITVRPIDTIAGPREFNEVTFDDVVVPRDCLLGEQDAGWELVVAGLTFERAGIARYARAGRIIELLVEWARPVSLQAAGEVPSTEASIARIHNGQLEQLVSQVGLELLGPLGQLGADDRSAPLAGAIRRHWARNVPTTIAAGTLEIQKNVVAQRGLGLPRSG